LNQRKGLNRKVDRSILVFFDVGSCKHIDFVKFYRRSLLENSVIPQKMLELDCALGL